MTQTLKLLAGAALALATTAATAGLMLIPIAGFNYDPGGPVEVRATDTGDLTLTGDLRARLISAAGGRGPAGSFIPLRQRLEVQVDPVSGDVHGRSRAVLQLPTTGESFVHQAYVSGKALCLAAGGQACAQLTVNLNVEGTLVRQADGQVLGHFDIRQLGTLVQDGATAQWLAIAASGQVAGAPDLLRRVLDTMEDEEGGA